RQLRGSLRDPAGACRAGRAADAGAGRLRAGLRRRPGQLRRRRPPARHLFAARPLRRRDVPPRGHPHPRGAPGAVRRRRAPAPRPAPWALLSYLLRYPGPEVAAAGPELRAEVAALPDGPVRASLGRFMAAWTDGASALAARYVETFDLRRRATLELTYYAHGDTRERGMALLRLK